MQYPNSIMRADGFFVSYNAVDVSIYGSDTTALVFGQMERFLILNGDHRQQYKPLLALGWQACVDYFVSQASCVNKRSDPQP